ncbi:hypothetical protein Pta02_19620 [Planobispora takensis]|uniref:Uncharacterized protein n=1 Tax=Planobispora takensis TaxID=1367882 RepID=A0A8J3SSQ8_9ACTN|nr:hypothetical protein Pta02_19620 [Planobispora takensis]
MIRRSEGVEMDHIEGEAGGEAEDRRPLCPRCDVGRLAPLLYGYLLYDEEVERDRRAGLLVYGGCMPEPERLACPACDTRYREVPGPDQRWGNILHGMPWRSASCATANRHTRG